MTALDVAASLIALAFRVFPDAVKDREAGDALQKRVDEILGDSESEKAVKELEK